MLLSWGASNLCAGGYHTCSEPGRNSELPITLSKRGPESRLLAAVAFLDVVNYTAMMAEAEARTHVSWTRLREDVIQPAIAEHGGVNVKSTGDGLLARFGSALDAVEWADRVQQAIRNAQDRRGHDAPAIEVRIAIHIGDVISAGGDIFGDCVNYAARLLEHAGPGRVIMSQAVYDLVRTSAGARARDLGLIRLKSYGQPARLFEMQPHEPALAGPVKPGAALPSIAVLPLVNLSLEEPDDYFADGVVEDVVVSLSAIGDLLVVSRASSLTFRGLVTDPRDVGRALGVRYVLMGTLRRSPRLIRVGWQLCSAEDGLALWSEKVEVTPGELFEMQDRIVTKIAVGIAPKVRAVELRQAMRKRPENFTAYDHMLRGLHLLHRLEPDSLQHAYECLQHAMREDPFYAMPFAWAAWWQVLAVGQAVSPDPALAIETAGKLAARAVELDGTNALALAIYGHVKSYLSHQYEIGLQYVDRAIQAGPSHSLAWTFSSCSLAYTGRGEQAVAHAEHALRLSPLDQNIFFLHSNLCLAHYVNGNFAEAARWGQMSQSENPRFSAGYRLLAASLVGSGEIEPARAAAQRMLEIEPGFSLAAYRSTRQPFRDPAVVAPFLERLSAAGLPE